MKKIERKLSSIVLHLLWQKKCSRNWIRSKRKRNLREHMQSLASLKMAGLGVNIDNLALHAHQGDYLPRNYWWRKKGAICRTNLSGRAACMSLILAWYSDTLTWLRQKP